MKLNPQAMGVLSMAFLKCLAEQVDITELLGQLEFVEQDGELFIPNPPIVHISKEVLQNVGDDDNA